MDDGAETQPTQAATQFASQFSNEDEPDIWGALIPCNPRNEKITRINLLKTKRKYTVGRAKSNDIVFPEFRFVSSRHCTIEWDGDEAPTSAVVLTDTSTNGTYIDRQRVADGGMGKSRILKDKCELTFGTLVAHLPDRDADDYRFIFRFKAAKRPPQSFEALYDPQYILGNGAYGTVWKALNKGEGAWYAVKIIEADKLRKGLIIARQATLDEGMSAKTIPEPLQREITIMQRLKHKNICQFKEVFYEPKNINIVMEWVRGGDLMTYLEKHDAIPEPKVQQLTYQICDALAYVHSLDIVHRDLKPENILLTDDNPPVIKIADFGLAKVVDALSGLHTHCGTPEYTAPEVVLGAEYDHKVDSWSVGVIVHAMLTFSSPFLDTPEPTDLVTRIASRRPDWSVLQTYHVSPEGFDFVRRLLEYDPKKRMTLTEAREHPWLAHIARAHREQEAAAAAASALGSQSESGSQYSSQPLFSQPVVHVQSQPLAPDASMLSVVSDRMALDTASIVMATPDEEQDGGGGGENGGWRVGGRDSRGATPVDTTIDVAPPSQDTDLSMSFYGSGWPRLSRRLPGQSQNRLMQPGDAADDAGADVSVGVGDQAAAPATAPGVLAAVAADAHDEAVGQVGVDAQETGVAEAPPAGGSRGSKRKAEDLGDEPSSSPPPDDERESTRPGAGIEDDSDARRAAQRARSGQKDKGPSRRPAAKRARSGAQTAMADEKVPDEQPAAGEMLVRRRSSRLASGPTQPKPNPGRQA